MKINEVEALVGITKKNIRFYEAEELLSPRRNSENGYRDYGDTDIATLRQIKLLRKLGVPLEEIRQMQQGDYTVGDGMRRHLITLEREQCKLQSAIRFCAALTDCPDPLEKLDAQPLLAQIEQMEQEGTTFMDKQKTDTNSRRYAGPVAAAVLMALLMAGVIWLMLWAFRTDPVDAPPLPLLILLIAIPAVVILGVGIALVLRIRELKHNEADDARQY